MDKNKQWTINHTTEIFSCKICRIIKHDCYLASRDVHNDFYSLKMGEWVNVFALTAGGKVIMVKQHRLGNNQVTLEVPAGLIDPGEKPETAALRELEEETGYTTNKLVFLHKSAVNPAIQTNNVYYYLALDCEQTKEKNFDPTEEIEHVLYEQDEIFNAPTNGLITHSLSMLGVLLAKDYLENRL